MQLDLRPASSTIGQKYNTRRVGCLSAKDCVLQYMKFLLSLWESDCLGAPLRFWSLQRAGVLVAVLLKLTSKGTKLSSREAVVSDYLNGLSVMSMY